MTWQCYVFQCIKQGIFILEFEGDGGGSGKGGTRIPHDDEKCFLEKIKKTSALGVCGVSHVKIY